MLNFFDVHPENSFASAGNLLGAGFITPAFFAAGALLAAIPIIIHILNRRRFKTVQWAAMEFLLRAMRKNRRRLRFEQWLLLAVRCCALLLLGLALARPTGCEDSSLATMAGQRSGVHVIVIDNSYSMAYEADRTDARTQLDQAKLLAKQEIDRLSAGGESVAVITAARPATAIIAKPAYDLEAAKTAVDRIEQSFSGTDLLGALQKASDIAREEAGDRPKMLYVLDDGTRSAWENGQAEALASLGKQLATQYNRVTHFNLARPTQWNHAVLSVKSEANLVRSDFSNAFQATVRGFGGQSDATLQWRLDEQPLPGSETFKPELNTPPRTQAQAQINQGGTHVITAALTSDNRLKADDTRWRVVDVASELKVLIVEGERGLGRLQGSGSFLRLALAPPSEEGSHVGIGQVRTQSYVMPEVISDLELGNKVLGDYRAIILTSVGQISAPQADQLKAFVQQGGTLMVFMGEDVNADAYNQVLLPRQLMPGPLTRRMRAAGDQKPYTFDFQPYGSLHPLLQAFSHREHTGLETAQIYTYWQVELPADGRAQRVMNYVPDEKNHQDPAITIHDLGNGRVVFFSTTAGPTSAGALWTTLPAKPVYVALMHELLAGSVTSGDRWMNLTVGQPLEIPPTIQLTGVPTLKDPQQADIVVEETRNDAGQSIYRSRPLSRPGVYRLTTGNRSYPIAVNVPDDEADIRPLDSTAIKKALGDIQLVALDDQLPPETAAAQAGHDYGWSVMLAVLALVGLEWFRAMRFGHYRR
jgi:hypothetical protein